MTNDMAGGLKLHISMDIRRCAAFVLPLALILMKRRGGYLAGSQRGNELGSSTRQTETTGNAVKPSLPDFKRMLVLAKDTCSSGSACPAKQSFEI